MLLLVLLLLLLYVAAVTIVAAKPQAALAEPSVALTAGVVLRELCSCQMFCRVPCCGTAKAAAHCLEAG